jgi:prepilin signal peptidase PulO-like enzyme (type II secretory pathway)
MPLAVVVYLGVIGAAIGSFIDAAVWRLHTGRSLVRSRSECESCHHRLGPAELVPVVSWIVLRGRCRHCGVTLEPWSPLVEATVAATFVLSAYLWPSGLDGTRAVASFVVWLLCVGLLGILAGYDLRWMSLPNVGLIVLAPLALAQAALHASLEGRFTPAAFTGYVLAGAAVLGGGYLAVHLVSGGRWVGMGDVKLAALAGVLTGWVGGLLTLAVANGIGAVVYLGLMATGRLPRGARLAFGPFLALGVVVAVLVDPH